MTQQLTRRLHFLFILSEISFQGLGIIQTKKDQMEQVFYEKLREEKEFEVHRRLTEEEDIAIQENIKELMKKKISINQVRLGYTAYVKSEMSTWTKLCGPIFSSVINNKKSGKVGDLKICRMSTHTSEADGGQEIFMFVSKVDKSKTTQLTAFIEEINAL